MQYPEIRKNNSSYTAKDGKKVLVYDNGKAGIAFEINEATKCIGITVHKPGDIATESFSALFGTLKKR